MTNLVSTEWLEQHLNEVRVVDASWYMPDEKRQPAQEFEQAHIPGAVFFDIDKIADTSNPLPHMLPSPEVFAGAVCALGIALDLKFILHAGLYVVHPIAGREELIGPVATGNVEPQCPRGVRHLAHLLACQL